MQIAIEWLAVVMLACWFAATLCYQLFFHLLMPVARRWDVFRVVPSWHLYIEVPLERRIYFRDRDTSGSVGAWREVPMRLSNRPWRACFNPDLREADASLSFAEFLCDEVLRSSPLSPCQIQNGVGWRGVWLVVSAQPAESGVIVATRQFEVRKQPLSGHREEEVVYSSDFMTLSAGKGVA